VIVLSMALPVILSAVGPFYYGYTHGPYWRVIVWALACTVSTLCFMRSSFKHMWDAEPGSVIGKLFSVAMAVIIVAVCLLVGNSAVYLLARAISSSSTSSLGTSAGLGYVILSVGVLWLLWSWSKWRMKQRSYQNLLDCLERDVLEHEHKQRAIDPDAPYSYDETIGADERAEYIKKQIFFIEHDEHHGKRGFHRERAEKLLARARRAIGDDNFKGDTLTARAGRKAAPRVVPRSADRW
jgi:hypothetical protein